MNQRLSKVLIIENDPGAARLIGYILEEAGYEVLTASNGVEGLRRVKERRPDLVVLDVMLPGVDGFEVCHRLKSDPNTKAVPVLILSAKAREADRKVGLKAGADDYLAKPADPPDLLRRVEKLLAAGRVETGRVVAFLGCKDGVGTSTVVANVAIMVAQERQRVVVVDLCRRSAAILSLLGLTEEQGVYKLFGASDGVVDHQGILTLCATHHSGVKVLYDLHMAKGDGEMTTADIDRLLQELRKTVDYTLVDVPGRPAEADRGAPEKCDLVVMVTDSGPEGLASAKARAGLLSRTGLDRSRLALVVIDTDGALSDVDFSGMKPIVEAVQVPLLGVVPHDLKVALQSGAGGLPVALAESNRPVAVALRHLTRRLIGYDPGAAICQGVAGEKRHDE